MEAGTGLQSTVYEKQLIGIIRRLPEDRVSQVIDFAKFIEFQSRNISSKLIHQDETEQEIAQENARWDTLLARDESQSLLEKMADEALAEIQAGNSKPMIFNKKSQLKQR